MGEIIELFQYSPTNNTTSWTSEVLNMIAAKYITFTVYCSENFDLTVEWAITSDFINIIDTETTSVNGGFAEILQLPIKAQYIRFKINNIAATPNILATQGFFFE